MRFSAFALLLFASGLAVADTPAPNRLGWHLSPGKKVRVSIRQEVSSNAKLSLETSPDDDPEESKALAALLADEVDSNATSEIWLTFEATEVTLDGTSRVRCRIDRQRLRTDLGDGKATLVDTEDMTGMSHPQAELLKLEMANEFEIELTPNGEATVHRDTDVIQPIYIRIASAVLFAVPESIPTIGDQWSSPRTPMGERQAVHANYKYAGIRTVDRKPMHVVEFEAETEQPNDDAFPSNFKLHVFSGKSAGKVYFDAKSGRVSRIDIASKMMQDSTSGKLRHDSKKSVRSTALIEIAKPNLKTAPVGRIGK